MGDFLQFYQCNILAQFLYFYTNVTFGYFIQHRYEVKVDWPENRDTISVQPASI